MPTSCASRATEAGVLLNELLDLELADEDVAALHQRAEGWPAAVYLAGLSLRNRVDRHEFIVRFAGDDRHIVDYLGEEVLADLDPDTRELLLRTSILERVNGPLCDAIATPPARRGSWRRSRARICSSSRSMTGATGTATTTCSAPV